MSDDYDAYDDACERMRKTNEGYLELFEQSLVDAGLSDKTIRRHISNVDFFINTYLLTYDVRPMEDGCGMVDDFLGYFFIKKCMWSTPASIKGNAATFKKFYKCMLDNNLVSKESYEELLATIKANMADWLADCEEFNNVDGNSLFEDGDQDLFKVIYESVARSLGYQDLLGAAHASSFEDSNALDSDDLLTREEAIDALTLSLFYLTAWQEEDPLAKGENVHVAWKSADWDALDRLRDAGFVACSNKAKSATLTKAGLCQAQECLTAFGLNYLC